MSNVNRRHFLTTGVIAGTGSLLTAGSAAAINPIRRNNRPLFRLSLAAYSYRRFLALNNNPTMTLHDFIDRAATMPLDAVELTGYYFTETSASYLAGLKGHCTRLGLDISGSATRNDFCITNVEQRRQQITHVKNWIEHTSLLGGKTLRVFAGRVPNGSTEAQAQQRCIDGFGEVCEHAANFGVYVALENHGGITGTPEQMLPIVRGVRSDWFGVNLDTGNFHGRDPYAELAQLAPYAVNVQVKTEIRRAGQNRSEDADLPRLVRILREANYRGYIALEHEANEDPRTAVPQHLAALNRAISG